MVGVFQQKTSKHPPVFGEKPIVITFEDLPRLHDSFKFINKKYGVCYTSMLQHLEFKDDVFVLETMNSLYTLEVIE